MKDIAKTLNQQRIRCLDVMRIDICPLCGDMLGSNMMCKHCLDNIPCPFCFNKIQLKGKHYYCRNCGNISKKEVFDRFL